MPRPIPVPDELSKPFWDACNDRQLVMQRCSTCSRNQHPPEPTCRACGSAEHLEWIQTSGRGSIIGYLVVHDSRIALLQAQQPFNLAVVRLEDDPAINFFSNLPGVPVDRVPVGSTVEVEWEQVSPEQLYPEWRVVG